MNVLFLPFSIVHDPRHNFGLSVYQLVRFLVNFLDATVHINLLDYHALVDCVMRPVRVVIHIELLKFIYMLAVLRRRGSEHILRILWRRWSRGQPCNAQLAFTVSVTGSWRCKLRRCGDWRSLAICICDEAVTLVPILGLTSDGCLQVLPITLSLWLGAHLRRRAGQLGWFLVEMGSGSHRSLGFNNLWNDSALRHHVLLLAELSDECIAVSYVSAEWANFVIMFRWLFFDHIEIDIRCSILLRRFALPARSRSSLFPALLWGTVFGWLRHRFIYIHDIFDCRRPHCRLLARLMALGDWVWHCRIVFTSKWLMCGVELLLLVFDGWVMWWSKCEEVILLEYLVLITFNFING